MSLLPFSTPTTTPSLCSLDAFFRSGLELTPSAPSLNPPLPVPTETRGTGYRTASSPPTVAPLLWGQWTTRFTFTAGRRTASRARATATTRLLKTSTLAKTACTFSPTRAITSTCISRPRTGSTLPRARSLRISAGLIGPAHSAGLCRVSCSSLPFFPPLFLHFSA